MTTATEKLRAVFADLSRLPEEEQDRFADRIREMKLEELRAEIRKGLESGPGTPWSLDEFLERAHAGRTARKGPKK